MNRGKGNTFSVSCGLSYAVQKQATLVNASLGYYSHGQVDPILLHYVRLCNDANPDPIPILAAAGNIAGSDTMQVAYAISDLIAMN